jgi:hypothetical protein
MLQPIRVCIGYQDHFVLPQRYDPKPSSNTRLYTWKWRLSQSLRGCQVEPASQRNISAANWTLGLALASHLRSGSDSSRHFRGWDWRADACTSPTIEWMDTSNQTIRLLHLFTPVRGPVWLGQDLWLYTEGRKEINHARTALQESSFALT